MSYCQGEYIIKSKKNLAKNCYDITVFCPDMAEQAQAGQFVHIRIKGFSLRRPISICQIDRKNGLLRLVFEVRGAGTQAMADWNTGDMIDLIGPLGHGFTLLDPDKKAIVVGGGIGTPPMLEVADHYKQNATAIIGFRSAEAVILAEDFENVLKKNRERDIRMKMTSAGPHRDDLSFVVNGIDIRKYGSQGQQRTAALSLKLSEIYLVKEKIKDTPILLLDDVLSELDSNRQTYLLDCIHDIQTLITCTGLDDFVSNQFHINKVFRVIKGEVYNPVSS